MKRRAHFAKIPTFQGLAQSVARFGNAHQTFPGHLNPSNALPLPRQFAGRGARATYVRPDQQRDGETFFHGLDFVETKRIAAGDGLLLVFEQRAK